MEYITVYETFKESEANILASIFKDHGIRYRKLEPRPKEVVPIGYELQVFREDRDRALVLIRENGFLGRRLATTDESPTGKFWIYLFVGLVIVIIVGVVVSLLLE